MTISHEVQAPRNLSGWLFHDGAPTSELAEQALVGALQESRSTVLQKLGKVARASLSRQLVDALKKILPGDPVTVFREAWQDYTALRQAGEASAKQPEAERVVALKDHKVTFQQEPTFEVVVAGAQLTIIKTRLEVVFTLCKPEAIVRAGRLTMVQAGRTSVTGSVQVEQVTIAQQQYLWPYEFVVGFNPGLDLTRTRSSDPTSSYHR